MGFAPAALVMIERAGPSAVQDRVMCEFVEGLAQERGGGPTPANLVLASAAHGDWRNPGVLLHLGGRREARAVGAKRDQQAGRQRGAGSRERLKERGIRMPRKAGRNGTVEFRDMRPKRAELIDQQAHDADRARDDGVVPREGDRARYRLQAGLDGGRTPTAVAGVKAAKGGGPGPLQPLERRPLAEELAGHGTREIRARPVERLGKVVLERCLQLLRELGAQVDGRASALDQATEQARLRRRRPPRVQLIAMLDQEREEQPRIGPIVLGAVRTERLAEAAHAARIDGIENQERGVEERVDERPTRGFDGNPNRPPGEASGQLREPLRNRFRRVFEAELLHAVGARGLQRDIVVILRPIDADGGGQRNRVNRVSCHCDPRARESQRALARCASVAKVL